MTPQGTYEVYETDMLVCGCGYAGMSAAANAAKSGLNVTVVEKGPFGSGGVAGMTSISSPPGSTIRTSISLILRSDRC